MNCTYIFSISFAILKFACVRELLNGLWVTPSEVKLLFGRDITFCYKRNYFFTCVFELSAFSCVFCLINSAITPSTSDGI